MSSEKIKLAQVAIARWNAGEMDAAGELLDPGVIMRMLPGWPEPGPFIGREAVMREFAQMRDAWAGDTLELISDPIEAGDRVAFRFRSCGVGHGPNVDVEATTVYTVRQSRIFGIEHFWSHTEALEILGLSGTSSDDLADAERLAEERG